MHLTVENVRRLPGNIVITLYGDDPARWLVPNGSLHIYTVPARARVTQACIILPGPGRYAIGVYHDSNSNAQIDRRGLLPTEGAGLSENPRIWRFVWPRLRPSLMTVNRTDTPASIRLRYPPFIF